MSEETNEQDVEYKIDGYSVEAKYSDVDERAKQLEAARKSDPEVEDSATSNITSADLVDQQQRLLSTTDARTWAQEFMKLKAVGVSIDEGLMIGWFANAIETARTAAEQETAARKLDPRYEAFQKERAKYPHLGDSEIERVQALQSAREILRSQTSPISFKPPDVLDLYHIAEYILTGIDPWEETTAEDASAKVAEE